MLFGVFEIKEKNENESEVENITVRCYVTERDYQDYMRVYQYQQQHGDNDDDESQISYERVELVHHHVLSTQPKSQQYLRHQRDSTYQ